MTSGRANSIRRLLADLTVDFIDTQQYFEDLEPQMLYDTALRGKVLALQSYLKLLGRSDLSDAIEGFQPIQGNAFETLTFIADHIAPEVSALLDSAAKETEGEVAGDEIWALIHPRIRALAKPRFDAGFYADAVSTAMREVNIVVKDHVRREIGEELDGAGLMTRAFSRDNPVIRLADADTETGRNIQQGYMHLYQGAMIGIRNPKAHGNYDTERVKAIHLLFVASLLMTKYDERVEEN